MDNPVFCRDGDAHVFGGSANQKVCKFFPKNPAKIKEIGASWRPYLWRKWAYAVWYGGPEIYVAGPSSFRNSHILASCFLATVLKFNTISLFTIVPQIQLRLLLCSKCGELLKYTFIKAVTLYMVPDCTLKVEESLGFSGFINDTFLQHLIVYQPHLSIITTTNCKDQSRCIDI